MKTMLKGLWREQSGDDVVEYALLVAMIALGVLVGIYSLGTSNGQRINHAAASLSSGSSGGGGQSGGATSGGGSSGGGSGQSGGGGSGGGGGQSGAELRWRLRRRRKSRWWNGRNHPDNSGADQVRSTVLASPARIRAPRLSVCRDLAFFSVSQCTRFAAFDGKIRDLLRENSETSGRSSHDTSFFV